MQARPPFPDDNSGPRRTFSDVEAILARVDAAHETPDLSSLDLSEQLNVVGTYRALVEQIGQDQHWLAEELRNAGLPADDPRRSTIDALYRPVNALVDRAQKWE